MGAKGAKLVRAAVAVLLVGVLGLASPASLGASGPVVTLRVADIIGPASADFIVRGLEQAAEADARLVVIELDTPGGLDTSMRQIIKAILASPVPVATFVAPGGARAASAGTFILYASHIAAMAPATNLGAASPVTIGPAPGGTEPSETGEEEKSGTGGNADAMSRKMMNDAAAYIRSLAELRGRNADWGEQAVREAASISAEDARASGVIEYIAKDVPDLLRQIDGLTVQLQVGEVSLATGEA
ncbi:MAG: nodulation protein NfeD, partial [Gammaproteobacteria bacterium]|nr:nodulation protein NfeD [Gammaproteobacteria bacterium]